MLNSTWLKNIAAAAVLLTTSAVAGTASAAVVHPASISGVTVTPGGYIDSASQAKSEFGNLGDADVLAAMKTDPWFGTSSALANITALANVGSGNCNAVGSLTTCSESPVKQGTYTGTSSAADDGNLFVVHVGGPGGGTVLAFLYSFYLDDFSVSGFANGVSWIRAFRAPDFIRNGANPVPVPGAAILLLSGLAALGGVAGVRRRMKAA